MVKSFRAHRYSCLRHLNNKNHRAYERMNGEGKASERQNHRHQIILHKNLRSTLKTITENDRIGAYRVRRLQSGKVWQAVCRNGHVYIRSTRKKKASFFP